MQDGVTGAFTHKVGEWRAIKRPIPMNRYRNNLRPQFSYFRYGLDLLQELIFKNYSQIKKEWQLCIQLIAPAHLVSKYGELL